eukprot:CAMPEP_0176171680 /NCGR_PEP_ID=MMETSP0120_2-20121206/87911_1 /TAXON_ID=160619 /ORGANISM="Kryptoperidinium foliaceum, Strain CCMP 1326" /LENGTH=35 /DNA_ID= /DNA_START= /DNA_END= /DNA_ORIENTATION=
MVSDLITSPEAGPERISMFGEHVRIPAVLLVVALP